MTIVSIRVISPLIPRFMIHLWLSLTLIHVGSRYLWQYSGTPESTGDNIWSCVWEFSLWRLIWLLLASSPSCFSRLVPCGVLVWFLQQGMHLALQGSLRMKYRCFFSFFSASACSEQGLQTGTAVLLSPSVWRGETDWCQDIDRTSRGAQGVYLYLKTKFHFNAMVWEEQEK